METRHWCSSKAYLIKYFHRSQPCFHSHQIKYGVCSERLVFTFTSRNCIWRILYFHQDYSSLSFQAKVHQTYNLPYIFKDLPPIPRNLSCVLNITESRILCRWDPGEETASFPTEYTLHAWRYSFYIFKTVACLWINLTKVTIHSKNQN